LMNRRLKVSFYGDDFTGSTDAMEALTLSGLRTVLFLRLPSSRWLDETFPDLEAIGLAGTSRQMSPEEMERDLRPALARLAEIPSTVVHYKVCSTFDSSPQVGSIGKVIDMGKDIFRPGYIPLVVGVPPLKRYTVFGNHFVRVGEETYRLDRHPTMSRHPITPMDEADLRLHLGRQTNSRMALMDVLDLAGDMEEVRKRLRERTADNPDVVLFDVLDDEHLLKIGQLLWEEARNGQRFIVGSSGVEYALGAWFQQTGGASRAEKKGPSPLPDARQILVASASCSPVTRRQIEWALANGFAGIRVPAEQLVDPGERDKALEQCYREAVPILEKGGSLILYTALGPDDPSLERTRERLRSLGLPHYESGKLIGTQLGMLTRRLLKEAGIRRLVVAGGDTAGYLTQQLDIIALEIISPVDPGGPLCRVYSGLPDLDGLEIALKGGQVGQEDYFAKALHLR